MNDVFSKEEKAAMRAAATEAKAARAGADAAKACDEAIGAMSGSDRQLARTLHELVTANTTLSPKTWYGMPAYANADGKTIVFFQSAAKFKVRYATIGFQPDAQLDEGTLWSTSFAVTALGDAERNRILALLEKAVG
jgi:uncharacterized protein YdhG (YjbR/CyaY superfamily)